MYDAQTALEERKKIETEYQCAAREFRQELDVAKKAAVSLCCVHMLGWAASDLTAAAAALLSACVDPRLIQLTISCESMILCLDLHQIQRTAYTCLLCA